MAMQHATVSAPVRQRKSALHRTTAGDIVIAAIVTLLTLTMLYPFLNLVFQSFSSNVAITASGGMMFWPTDFTIENYVYVLKYPNVWQAYKNTVFITVMGTSLSLVMTTLGGYSLSKRNLPLRMPMTLLILITMFVGGGLIPNYLNLKNLGFLNTLWVMIIPDTISTGNLLLMRNFFLAMPQDLKDSAYIDGAGEVRTLISIVLPLSTAIIATMALFYGVGNWNEFTAAIIYNHEEKYYPIQVIIQRMYSESVKKVMDDEVASRRLASEAIKSATVVFGTLPIVCVYPFLQKHFAKGVMVGSLKG